MSPPPRWGAPGDLALAVRALLRTLPGVCVRSSRDGWRAASDAVGALSRHGPRSGWRGLRVVEVISVMVALRPKLVAEVVAGCLQRSSGLQVVHQGATGVDAVEVFGRVRPDVALFDHVMPGLNGPEAVEAIREVSSTAKVLLVASVYGPEDVERALAAGAVGFLPKSLSVSQVVDAVRQAHQGRPLVYADELAAAVDRLNDRARQGDDLYEAYATLTDRELDVLRLLGDGKTRREIAATLEVSTGTLKNDLARISAKTGARTRMEAIDLARRLGLIPTRAISGSAPSAPVSPQLPRARALLERPPSGPITLAVAHAQPLVAEALCLALAERPDLAVSDRWSTTGREVVKEVARGKPRVALVDFWLPDMAGPAAARAILRASPATNVIFLTEYFIGPVQHAQVEASGALGNLTVSAGLDDVALVIHRAAAVARVEDAGGDVGVDDRRRRLMALTAKEIEVLQVLRRGLTTREAAGELLISPGTLKNHIHNILVKTNVATLGEALVLAEDEGFISDR